MAKATGLERFFRGARASRLRATLPGLLVACPAALWVWGATIRASWATLGRDQGIFQYVAWAIGEGDTAFRDVRDVNGPLVAMIHLALQALGGADEHRFRVLDLAIGGIAFAFVGACLPSLGHEHEHEREHESREGGAWAAGVVRRGVWALAAWTALSAQYLAYGFWDTAQRESFFDWFLALALGLQMLARGGDRRSLGLLAAAGAASVLPIFGKPTFVVFTLGQLVAIALDDAPRRSRRIGSFVVGALAGSLAPMAFLVSRGDVAAWARISFVDVPAMYRFIWPRPASAIVAMPGYGATAALAIGTTLLVVALVATARMPRRALAIGFVPVLGLLSVIAQAKGFPYHFHPVSFGTTLAWLAVLAWAPSRFPGRGAFTAALVLSALFGFKAARAARESPDPETPAVRGARNEVEVLEPFERIDYFPVALRNAARHVAEHTKPTDRVQMYGMDAYVLYLARRLSASPYIYAYDLDDAAAQHGSFEEGGLVPSEEQRRVIRRMRDEHERDLVSRMEKGVPAAFVFVGRSPLMTSADAVEDFETHCPLASRVLVERYRETADFEGIRVWLRKDLAPEEPISR